MPNAMFDGCAFPEVLLRKLLFGKFGQELHVGHGAAARPKIPGQNEYLPSIAISTGG